MGLRGHSLNQLTLPSLCQVKPLHHQISRRRLLSSSARCLVNPLQNLSHFSAAKEAQFLSKEKRIPREEFHPYLQLIRSSEVDPFAPVPGASPTVVAALKSAKTGEADTDTALRLAVSNLIDQVQASRQETASVLRALSHVQQRYKREERNAFLMLFATIGLLGFIIVKTRALNDLFEYVGGVRGEWNDFDWQSLENSSLHGRHAQSMNLIPMKQNLKNTQNTQTVPSLPNATTLETPEGVIEPCTVQAMSQKELGTDSKSKSHAKSFLYRMFWAAPANDRL